MEFKVIDGVAYKLEKVDDKEIKNALAKSVKVIADAEKKLSEIDKNRKNTAAQFDKQISEVNSQMEALSEKLKSLQEKKQNAMASYDEQCVCPKEVRDAEVESLKANKELIIALFPDEAKKVGF